MDPENPIVKLCVEGMKAEGEGRHEDAHNLFIQAWAARQDDFDACVAAHYVARHQASLEETLHWNQESLKHADSVGDERVQGFYPSLYLNMGWSHEMLGNLTEASIYYKLAQERVGDLPPGPYGDLVRNGIAGRQKQLIQAVNKE